MRGGHRWRARQGYRRKGKERTIKRETGRDRDKEG